MRVLYVSHGYSCHDRRFLKAIIDQGHQLWFACEEWDGRVRPIQIPEKVAVWPLSHRAVANWGGPIAELGIQVVHAGPIPTVAARVAPHISAPLVAMSWGSDILLDAANSPDIRADAVVALNHADAVIVDCRAIIAQIRQWLPDIDLPFIELPWGLDLDRFRELPLETARNLRQKLGWLDEIVVISTRAWEPHYAIEIMLHGFAMAAAANRQLRLLLVGDGSLRPSIDRLIAHLGLGDKVYCPGRIPEHRLPEWYCAADLYVSTSVSDGTSISLLEAMACGLAAIARNRYGNMEWIVDGETGWLAEVTEPYALARAFATALTSRDRWADMGQRARQIAIERADWDVNSQAITRAYKLALHRHGCRT